MALHNDLGKEGEDAAVDYLTQKGYEIRHRNWHSGHRDLDIVAQKDSTLVIVEVKTRRDDRFGQPEEAVDNRKIRNIVASTDAYVRKFAIDLPVRFDLITVVGIQPPFRIEHIEDAFFPPVWN
ncbi:YraN family protein [Bacteroides mediterraneensis]|uniref:YraN family protein n=1 Tax=Bacteroides mediterraneensis TaxID=1841856 RepID=UPI0019562055|nr:YraN family protein [Bacteroides mediterraneensis]MBM6781190.1 YraN family protein [Bacteroides mediterraneensis]